MYSYTRDIAYQEDRRRSRQAAALMPRSRATDAALSVLSIPYAVLGLLIITASTLLLLPVLLLQVRRKKASNISTAEGGSLTAVKTLNARAIAAGCGFGPDMLAIPLIRRRSLIGDRGAGWLLTQVYRQSVVLGFRLTRRLYIDQIVPLLYGDRFPISEITYLQLRTCWLDDVVEQFIASLEGRPGQVVVLGAGYDTRLLRLPLPNAVRRFEIDAPGTQTQKRASLQELAMDDAKTTYVTCDFASERWINKLREQGFSAEVPACFVWEGVTMYLTRDVVAATLQDVSACADGSIIGFDYFDPTWALTPMMRKRTARAGEPWQFGLSKEELAPFVEAQGLAVLDHLGHRELLKRYMPQHTSGTPAGYCGDFGAFALAGTGGSQSTSMEQEQ